MAVAIRGTPAAHPDDRAEIENLSNRHMIAIDVGEMDAVMAAWADDADLVWAEATPSGRAFHRGDPLDARGVCGAPDWLAEAVSPNTAQHDQIVGQTPLTAISDVIVDWDRLLRKLP